MRMFVALDLEQGLREGVKGVQNGLELSLGSSRHLEQGERCRDVSCLTRHEPLDRSAKKGLAGADVKFVEPENLHFTVKFLGELAEERAGDVSAALEEALSGVKGFRISIEGLSYFGPRGQIRTLFLDVKEGREELEKLTGAVSSALDRFRHESRDPRPHLTIGRVKSGRNREALLERIREFSRVKVGEMDVKFVKLKQSMLTEKGPVYSDVKVLELA